MTEEIFNKTGAVLSVLALDRVIRDKRSLLKNKLFKYYSEEELTKFIDLAKTWKKTNINILKDKLSLDTNEIMRYAKDLEKDFGDLYVTVQVYFHNHLFDIIKNEDPKNDIDLAKKELQRLRVKYVNE